MIKKIKDLIANKKNPRKITDKKLEMLKASIKEFGDLSGIIDNVNLGRIESGHQRCKTIPEDADIIIEKRFDPPTEAGTVAIGYVKLGTETMRYRQVNWDENKSMAANIAANKHGGDWDVPKLNEILLDLDASNYDLSLTGFTDTELENLLAPTNEITSDKDKSDENSHSEKCEHCGK